MARINEGTYSRVIDLGSASIGTNDYTPAVRDWVVNGSESPYVWSREETVERIHHRTPDQLLAEPTFKLGSFVMNATRRLGATTGSAPRPLIPTTGTTIVRIGISPRG